MPLPIAPLVAIPAVFIATRILVPKLRPPQARPATDRRRGSLATVIGLPGSGGDQGAGTLGLGLGDQELQLAGLVAAQGQPSLIVALDEDPRSAMSVRTR